MRGRVQVILAVAAATVALGGGTARAATPAAAPVATIKVAQFNCDISDEFPIIKAGLVARAIRASGADVVGIEEGGGEIRQIAQALHWRYYDIRMQIVSRLPLIDPPGGHGLYTFVEASPGRVVALENVHLPSAPYGPVWVKHGKTAAQVIAMEKRVRLPAIQPDLTAARSLHAQGIPVFLTGDFNSPSFRDWTKAAVGTRPDLRYPLRWPVSAAVEAAGFTDSFRAVYPNPVRVPGLTWPTHRTIPGVDLFRGEPKDRIDFVFAQGATPIASAIVGEPGSPGTAATVAPWPSDHRLVVSTFRVRGASPPALVTVPHRLVRVGDAVPASFHAGGAVSAVAIEHLRGGTATVVARRRVTAAAARGVGAVSFPSSGWAPGAYAAALLGPGGRVRSRYPFWVARPGAAPAVATTKATFATGVPIRVTVKNAPGDRWDWLGIYHRGADPLVASYLLWGYTHSAIDGTFSLRPSGIFAVPLTPGRYSVYLLRDDLYVKIAGAAFSVR
ncbi:MAG TPA: endonuclease/exonuclease/phosphatase family protein [Gaiellales bacterium]